MRIPRCSAWRYICCAFDEAMFHAIAKSGIEAVTVSMDIEYVSPAFEGHILVCEGEVEKRDGRKIDVIATLTDAASGKLIAKARGDSWKWI